ncbi:MAG: general secretion pathway protein GspK [Planctomycetaceae bacterium]|nr:general secretion pathway protein GspK [Planctomycetaceae bacterium]
MSKNRGVILVIVLIVITILSLSVLAYSRFMLSEKRGVNQSLRQRQVRLIAESGVEYLRFFLMNDDTTITEYGGIYDNENEFCGHIVTDGSIAMNGSDAGLSVRTQFANDPMNIGRFSIVVPRISAEGYLAGDDFRYGLEDESSKLNLRWLIQIDQIYPGLGRNILLQLPGMTEEIADSILDWCDEDSEPREYGAEDEYYAALEPPYYTQNKIPDSIDELLLVKGITPKLLYGVDWNRNGILDEGEPDESVLSELNIETGELPLGLVSLLTLDSRESNRSPNGEAKININQEDIEDLRTQLESRLSDQTWVDYIIAIREQSSGGTENVSNSSGAAASSNSSSGSGSGSGSGSSSTATIKSLLELIQPTSSNTGTVSSNSGNVNSSSGGSGTGSSSNSNSSSAGSNSSNSASGSNSAGSIVSPFSTDPTEMAKYLPELYDNLTVSDTPPIGRININQASRPVLEIFLNQKNIGETTDSETVLQLSDIIDEIISARESDMTKIPEDDMKYPFWIYTHGIVTDFELLKRLEPYFCTQGAVFRANVIGRFDEKSPAVRLEVWLDASEIDKPAKIIRIRELTELGPGFNAESLGVTEYAK